MLRIINSDKRNSNVQFLPYKLAYGINWRILHAFKRYYQISLETQTCLPNFDDKISLSTMPYKTSWQTSRCAICQTYFFPSLNVPADWL